MLHSQLTLEMPSTLVMTSTTIIALVSLLHVNSADSEALQFIVEPAVGTVALNEVHNVTLQCLVNSTDHSYKPIWTLHYPNTTRYLSTHDDIDKAILLEKHNIHFYSGDNFTNITIPGNVENNHTLVWCTTFFDGATVFSGTIRIIIIGPPLPPHPNLKVLNSSQLQLQWGTPYSHESDPIEHYNIQILNTGSGGKLEHSVMENRYVYTTEDGNAATKCQWLVFNVTAVSTLGQSVPGKVSGGFPVAPQSLSPEINVAVTFYGNHTPIAKVSFEAPFICDYQTSSLTITIVDTIVTGLPGLVHQSNYTGRSGMITETFDTGLLANHTYTLTITTSDNTFADDVLTAAVNFSTTIHSAPPISQDVSSGLQVRDIVIFAGGVFVVLLVAIMTIVIVSAIVCLRKQKLRKAPGSTMDLMLNSINRSRTSGRMNGSQYDTPYKSNSSLYETIDGYQRRTPIHNATTATTRHSWQHQEYLWKPQQRNFERKKSEGAESLYQEMHSATEQGLVNGYNSRRAMKPQNLEAPHNNSLKLHTYQDELHAPASAGSTSCMSLSDSNTGPGVLSPQSESFGDHLSTIAVVNESIGSNAEGDQSEYAYMSQEGTLAGQQGKLMLRTNGCVSDSGAEEHVHSEENILDKTGISKNSAN